MGWSNRREPYGHGVTVVVDGSYDPFVECRRAAYRTKGGSNLIVKN